jgi:hypothetical protein
MENVVYLHGQPDPVSQFLRVGLTNHRRLEQMLLAGQLPVARVVVEAAAFKKQADLIAALRAAGRELVLDTNVAELSSIGRYQGAVRDAPWASPDGMLTARHLTGGNENDVVGTIARFAVANKIHRVHAPAHLLSGINDPWFGIDIQAVKRLRAMLDIEGGKGIPIDYPLLLPAGVLNDPAERKRIISVLADVPAKSLWLRVSGFGAEATPAGIRKYISALQDFHSLNIPLLADTVGGMAALAVVAFGAASGIAHGAAEKERFDACQWSKPRKERKGGGGGYTVLMQGIDRLLKKQEAEALIAAPHGRRLLSCDNLRCCPHGFEGTMKDPRGHYLRQRALQCEALSSVPGPIRAEHFLNKTLTDVDRKARQIAKLKVTNATLGNMLQKNSSRLDRMRAVLEDLQKTGGVTTRSRAFSPPHAGRHTTTSQGGN